MGCGHDHSHHAHHVSDRRMGFAVGLTILFVLGEAIAGWLGHSLALFFDAGHNLADAMALVFSWYALRVSRLPSTASRTFGYHRERILAALVNARSLVVIALVIAWEAVQRLRNPAPVQGSLVIAMATAAVALNTLIALWLRQGA